MNHQNIAFDRLIQGHIESIFPNADAECADPCPSLVVSEVFDDTIVADLLINSYMSGFNFATNIAGAVMRSPLSPDAERIKELVARAKLDVQKLIEDSKRPSSAA